MCSKVSDKHMERVALMLKMSNFCIGVNKLKANQSYQYSQERNARDLAIITGQFN